ncbi:MAG TPA: TMEM165/GDT1 family protein, partial [Burkholderiales bacterium]|nr:TMEM165/GDT1 family protein [Burkholderiales bacterium]
TVRDIKEGLSYVAHEPRVRGVIVGLGFGLVGAGAMIPLGPVLGLSFIGMAVWTLIPDKIEDEETRAAQRLGVFGATLITFFLAEMGDKTQLATVALAAHYGAPVVVVIGTTLGMLIADVPAVLVGNRFAAKIPLKIVHSIAAAIFAAMGVLALLKVEKLFQ